MSNVIHVIKTTIRMDITDKHQWMNNVMKYIIKKNTNIQENGNAISFKKSQPLFPYTFAIKSYLF